LYVWSYTQRIYHHRCSNMITYFTYMVFVGSVTSYVIIYVLCHNIHMYIYIVFWHNVPAGILYIECTQAGGRARLDQPTHLTTYTCMLSILIYTSYLPCRAIYHENPTRPHACMEIFCWFDSLKQNFSKPWLRLTNRLLHLTRKKYA
jgi:hypothetical protein